MYEATLEELKENVKQLEKISKSLHKLSALAARELVKEQDNGSLKKEFKDATEESQQTYYAEAIDLGYYLDAIENYVDAVTNSMSTLGMLKVKE